MATDTSTAMPRVGMLATVRNRHGLVKGVEHYSSPTGLATYLVTIEYLDGEGEESLLWHAEPSATVIEPSALPDVVGHSPMVPDHYAALVRATRWGAMTPFVDPDGEAGLLPDHPLTAPLHGAVEIDDYQLVPLCKALSMPRVALFIADDVGLGKTVEAGLLLTELIARQRIRRVLVLCPASLQVQWQEEMATKFALSFERVDRNSTYALRQRLGMDANPWRAWPRVIASYHYLKQEDVLQRFLSASTATHDSPHLPWDLLIVDEVHNLAPSAFGEDSQLARLLERIAPLFEHRVFLSATPHNGYTRCFTGLLERLDPVRFSQTSELTPRQRERVEQVVVRRLKTDINARSEAAGRPPRFATPSIKALTLCLAPEEIALGEAFRDFARGLRGLYGGWRTGDRHAGSFALAVLGKRLLSCPASFAASWWRCREGMRLQSVADATEVRAAQRAVDDETDDDREAESRLGQAAGVVGAWLQRYAERLGDQMQEIDHALHRLGLPDCAATPRVDTRYAALRAWIDRTLRCEGQWRDDERLIVFSEYKTTQDYLVSRLSADYPNALRDGRLRLLYGGLTTAEREAVKAAFNDPADPVRVLISTDTGSEGQNLQATARNLLHFDVPWNPSRLAQRNGRLDRHGQARDVRILHFQSDDDDDLRFLAYVVGKVSTIEGDLGPTAQVFDAALQRRFVQGEGVTEEALDRQVQARRQRIQEIGDLPRDLGEVELERLAALRAELDLDATTLAATLNVALAADAGHAGLAGPDDRGRYHVQTPVPTLWEELVDDSLRLPAPGGGRGPLPAVVFDPQHFVSEVGGRPVFRPRRDTALLHLGHPLFRRVLSRFAQLRFPGTADERIASRWSVSRGPIPSGADALLLLTVEELAVNELREGFHHWVRTWRLPITGEQLGEPLPHLPAARLRDGMTAADGHEIETARYLWLDVEAQVREFVRRDSAALTARLAKALDREMTAALQRERERFDSRQGELSALIEQTTLQRIERELEQLRAQRDQGVLPGFDDDSPDLDAAVRDLESELRRRREHTERLRSLLSAERQRTLDHVLPNRYALRGEASVFPVAVEIRLPAGPDQPGRVG